MNSALGLLVTVVLLKSAAPTLIAGKCPFLKDILETRGFRDLVLNATKTSYLDIFSPPEFGVEEHRLLSEFLKVLPASPRIFSCFNCTTTQNRYVALSFFCPNSYRPIKNWHPFPYWATLSVVAGDISEMHIIPIYSFFFGDEDILDTLRRGADFSIVVRDEKISVVGNYENRCLNCSSQDRRGFPLTLIRDLPIGGKQISLACLEPLICKSSVFLALTKSLLFANCSLEIVPVKHVMNRVFSVVRSLVDPAYILHAPLSYQQDVMFPTVSTPFYCDRAEFAVFAKALKPLPKEATLFMPFSPFVWAVFLACLVLSLLTSYLLCRFGRSVPGFQSIAAAFAASLVQQGYPVSSHAENIQSFRIIFGVWCLTAMILATGYKGVVTSLFCNVPMNGELKKLTSLGDALKQVPLPCFVNFPHEDFMRHIVGYDVGHHYDVSYGWFRHITGLGRVRDEANDEFILVNRPSESLSCVDRLRRFRNEINNEFVLVNRPSSKAGENRSEELLSKGFVKSNVHLSAGLTGPEMKSTSPYYGHIRKLLSRAFEAGLFERAERISNLTKRFSKFKRSRYGQPWKTEEQPLTLSNLQPCFVIWALGIGVSLLVFVTERVVSCCVQLRWRSFRRTFHQA